MSQPIALVDLARQNSLYREEWMAAIEAVVKSGRFVGGEEVEAFEREFASYCGCDYGVGTASGSDALRLALLALDVGPGDEVVTVSHTFVSTADAIVHVGARPVFVDIEPTTYTMDPEKLAAAMGPKVKAVIPVHLYGQPANMSAILEICEQRAVPIVEDAAQAHGATYGGRPCGSLGRIGCFSFYPSKNLGAFGDGGFITTDDDQIAERLRLLREYGQSEKYHYQLIGFNTRLDALQAAVLRRKLHHLDNWNNARRKIAKHYEEKLRDINWIATPLEGGQRHHVFHIYALRTRDRDSLRRWLSTNGVETGIHYPVPVHLQPSYSKIPFRYIELEKTAKICHDVLSLPMFPELSPEEVEFVCDSIIRWKPSK